MSKNTIAIITFLVLLVIFISAFSTVYTANNISNLAYLLALGIDVGENAQMKISAQFSKTGIFSSGSGTSSEDDSNIVLVSGEADSIFSGINLLNSYIGKEINLSHCSVVVFSEEFAKQGISRQIYGLINNEQMRPSTNIVISTCDAYDYIKNVKPNLEKLTVQYFDTFSITNRFTGYFSNATIGKLFNELSYDYCGSTAILGGLDASAREQQSSNSESESSSNSSESSSEGSSSDNSNSESGNNTPNRSSSSNGSSSSDSSNQEPQDIITNPEELVAGKSSIEGKRGSENIGLAVFDNYKYIGDLTAFETVCHMILQNEVDSCILTVEDPQDSSNVIRLNAKPSKKPKVSVDIKDDIPHISIDVYVEADILTLDKGDNYQTEENLDKLCNSAQKYLEQQMHSYVDKISKEYNIDIDHFADKVLSHFSTISEWKDFNWKEKFKDATFDINAHVDINSSLLLTKS